MGLSLVTKNGVCYDYGLIVPALMLQVVLVTMMATLLRITIINPTTAVVCFRWVLSCGSIVLM